MVTVPGSLPTVTIPRNLTVPGQARQPDGSWAAVPIVPGALQVFTGSLLARWTNGRLSPGWHRVTAGGTVTRRSSAVFVFPSLDTVVALLPEFTGEDGPEYDPLDVGAEAQRSVEEYLKVFGRPGSWPRGAKAGRTSPRSATDSAEPGSPW